MAVSRQFILPLLSMVLYKTFFRIFFKEKPVGARAEVVSLGPWGEAGEGGREKAAGLCV